MEESKPQSISTELSKSIYHLIKGSEPAFSAHDLKKESYKNVQPHSNNQSDAHKDNTRSYISEYSYRGIESTKRSETDDNETTLHESQRMPMLYSNEDRKVTPSLSSHIDPEDNTVEESRKSSISSRATEGIYDMESNSTTNEVLSPVISNIRRIHPSLYSLASDRLPMADPFSQYHILSQHGHNTSTSSLNTCNTRSSSPTFQSHGSVLTVSSDSELYFDNDDDLNLEASVDLEQIKKDQYLRTRAVYGSYDVRSHSPDSDLYPDITVEDVKLTSLRPFEDSFGAESNLKVSNSSKQKLNSPTYDSPSHEPPPLPASRPPPTPPSTMQLQAFETKGDNSIVVTQVNGNHVVQNMSNEMYKTMKQAIKPGKVNEIKKMLEIFHDKKINPFSPVQHPHMQKEVKNVDSLDSYEITGDTRLDIDDDKVKAERDAKYREQLTKEITNQEIDTEKTVREENDSFYRENPVVVVEAKQPISPKLKQKQTQALEKQAQKSKQEHNLQAQSLKETQVKQALPKTSKELEYFTDVETRNVGNSELTHSATDWPVTNSYTQEDHVSITNTTAITTTKPATVIMTQAVSEDEGRVSKEIIPVSAPLVLPLAKAEFTKTETVWRIEKEAESLQEADLTRKTENELKELSAKEKENNEGIRKEETNYEKEAESTAVALSRVRGKVEEKKRWEEKIEDKDMKHSNEKKKTEEKVQQVERNGEIDKYIKQLDKLKVTVRKETDSFIDITNNDIDGENVSDNLDTQLEPNVASDTLLSYNSPHKHSTVALLDETPGSLQKPLEFKAGPKEIKSVESTPTISFQTFSFSSAGDNETLTTTATLGTATTTTASKEVSHVSDTPRCLVNSNTLAGNNNSNSFVITAEESINSPSITVPTRQTSDIEEIQTTVSQVVNSTFTTVSPVAVSSPFSTENDGKDNKERKENKGKEIDAGELISWKKSTEVKKGRENEINDREKPVKETIHVEKRTSSAVRRSNSMFVPAKKEHPVSRTHSIDKLKVRPPTVNSATAYDNNKELSGTIFPFKELRQMFEEGRPLKKEDDEKDLPSTIETSAYPNNISAADRSNTEQARSNLYPWALHQESKLTRKTPSLTAKNRDVYLNKHSATEINKGKATCKTTTTTTNRTTTSAPITANTNQLSPSTSTTNTFPSVARDFWSGEKLLKNTGQNTNTGSSVLENAVTCSNAGSAGFSTSHLPEMSLELATIRKSDSDTTYKADGHDTSSKNLKVAKPAKTSALESNNTDLQITHLKTVSSTVQDNRPHLQYELSETLKRDNSSESSMDLRKGHNYAPVEKISSFHVRTHLTETDNKARTETATLSSNSSAVEMISCDDISVFTKNKTTDMKTTENKSKHSISTTEETNRHEDISQIPVFSNRDSNKYVSQIGVNSAQLISESARNASLSETKDVFVQNNSLNATGDAIVGTNFVPVNMYRLDRNFGPMVTENTALTRNLPISASLLTPGISTVITDVHLAPVQSIELSDVNSGQAARVNILAANEITQTMIGTTPPQLSPVQLVNVDRNIALNDAISNTAYNVGVDSTLQNTLSNNNEGTTMGTVSVSSPGIQYYSDSQTSSDTWQTTLNSTTFYTTLAPVVTGLTSSDQCGLSSTWNAGIPIPTTMTIPAHQHQQQQQQQDLIVSPTPSSVYAVSKERTEKSVDETSKHIQGNVFRKVVEFEKTPENDNCEKQRSHSFRSGRTVERVDNQVEDAEATYERVKRNLRPIPAKNESYLDINFTTKTNLDSSMDSSNIHDISSLRSSQTPSYYSVNESITSFPEDSVDQNVANNVNHQYAVVRLTPSNTDYNKVKHTIYCEVGGSEIKNETSSSSFNVMRSKSDLSNVSFSTPSTAASDTEDELSDTNDIRSDKQNFKKTNRIMHKNTVSESKQRTTDVEEINSVKNSTYKTGKNLFLNSRQSSNNGDHKMHHASEMAIDSGTGTEIISSEGETENQEVTETWCEYRNIPYEKYEQINKSSQNVSMNTKSWSPPSSLSVSSSSTTTTAAKSHYQTNIQHSEFKKATPPKDFGASGKSYLTKSDSNQIYEVHTEPETVSQEGEEDLKIVRGRLLIKNKIDSPKDGDDFDDNINVFAEEFHLDKENPLYQSDPDIYKHTEEEEETDLIEEWSEDITFDQVDMMAKSHKINTEGT